MSHGWRTRLLALVVPLVIAAPLGVPSVALAEEDNCASAANPIVCENALPGDPENNWQVDGVGAESIQGFATSMSVNAGETESFKIKTNASSYHIEILRLGYYGGDGARLVNADVKPTASLPQKQPECLKQSTTGLIDCGNWGVSASWQVPSNAVSGVYIAELVENSGGKSQIPFVVRNDSSHSEIVLQTSDAAWEAYNDWGGNSLYTCTVACPPGEPEGYKAAYAVSYNRPWEGSFAVDGGRSYLWYAEYQMIYWLEENGYNVSYTSESQVAQNAAQLKNHKLFISSGHDEYWSQSQRANVESALSAGVNLAFFSGNEMFWKTRWGASTEGSNVPYRTLTTYKETHFNKPVDPEDPPEWTGSWRDPRFSPPANGGRPENALTGQYFLVNAGTADLTVPSQYSKLRLWRNTAVASLKSGQSLTLAPGSGTLGYEWDEDVDNGFRSPGQFDLSETTVSGLQTFKDYGSNITEPTTGTHHLTLYKAPSGALVFGAGTVQWSWGLANVNAWEAGNTEPSNNPPDPNMEQFTVNLFAEMGVQPGSLTAGLVAGSESTVTTPPSSKITSPEQGATIADGTSVSVTGTATGASGAVVAGVEVSTNGGSTWHPATLTTPAEASVKWSYTWVAHGDPTTTIKTRAVDDSGNVEQPSAGVTVNVSCPCSIWGAGAKPANPDSGDGSSVEVGVKFTSESFGVVSGVRFYKSAANTGTHVGSLWSENGTLLASATFTGESESGWQQVNFSKPIQISAHTTYVVGYFAPKGHYAADPYYFYTPTPLGTPNILNSPPLHAVPATGTTANGFYLYTSAPAFPTESYNASNYWVDPVFTPSQPPGQVTEVVAAPDAGAATVSWSAPSSGGVVTAYTITPYIGASPQQPATVTGSPPETTSVVSGLTPGVTYTFTVQASNPSGAGPVSARSNEVTPPAVSPPSPPTGVSARPASKQALVSWKRPSLEGGSPISGYTVTPYVGSAAQTPVSVGASTTSTAVTGLTNGTTYTFKVTATNSAGTGEPSTASTAVTPEDTIFDFATPSVTDSGDPNSVELGVKFKAKLAGAITGIRFYKAATNTGTHIGSLWSESGKLLASATFTAESDSGWQTVTFAEPVAITEGATYVAGYFAPNGHYAAAASAFSSAGLENGPLQALANGTSANGVYAYGSSSAFPSSSYNATNYYVDVMFNPTPPTGPPSPPTGVFASVASGQAQVSWAAPSKEGGGAISGYTLTPFVGSEAKTPIHVGASVSSATVSGLANGTAYTFKVTATNSVGTSEASAASNSVTPEDTILELGTPAVIDSGDSSAVELGVKFTTSMNGKVTGIRFYKAQTNAGVHVGSLWTEGGALLRSASFSAEGASGWQQVTFSEPVAIEAGKTYVAGYFAPQGHYSATAAAFGPNGLSNPPLEALANGLSSNGVYGYSSGSTFPTNSFDATNYWVDVLFSPAARSAPEAPQGVTATPASSEALVKWRAPYNGGTAITGYTVTAYVGSTAQTPVSVGASSTSTTVAGLSNGTAYTFKVTATNAVGTSEPSTASTAVTPEDTIFDFATPSVVDSGDSNSVELGVKFRAKVTGAVTGIRFYKAATNTGTHIGSLWSESGTLLASATFTGEAESGWQEVTFSAPVPITEGTTYVAGYFAPKGHYSATAAAFSSAGVENGPLQALANGVSADGVYAYGSSSTFPSNSYNATNYWVDVTFAPGL